MPDVKTKRQVYMKFSARVSYQLHTFKTNISGSAAKKQNKTFYSINCINIFLLFLFCFKFENII